MSTENTQQESPDVIADSMNELRQIEIEGYEQAVKKARNALFWTAGLIVFWELFSMYRTYEVFDPAITIFAVAVGGLFVGLALWTKKKPYTALISGITAFIAYILLAVVANGMVDGMGGVAAALFSGILVKVLIFINLFRPLKDAKALQQAMKERY
ncbi:MAG: hypothetical protein EOO09_11345 [Chitinophagaceae bacterium]|nr:MAG: hypothetical protein EOO09_11345 [Chitinophagaceae bacterium]